MSTVAHALRAYQIVDVQLLHAALDLTLHARSACIANAEPGEHVGMRRISASWPLIKRTEQQHAVTPRVMKKPAANPAYSMLSRQH